MLKQGGFLDYWLGEGLTNASQCLRPPSTDLTTGISALNIDSLTGSFLLLAAGEGDEKVE